MADGSTHAPPRHPAPSISLPTMKQPALGFCGTVTSSGSPFEVALPRMGGLADREHRDRQARRVPLPGEAGWRSAPPAPIPLSFHARYRAFPKVNRYVI